MRAEVQGASRDAVSRDDDALLIPAALTDSGCEREFNEDRYAVIDSPSGLVWLVCDGMGGVTGGELAAQLAIETIRRDLERKPLRTAIEALESAIVEANRVIILRRQNELFSGMGTTLVGAIFQGPEVVLSHIGDSRAYLVSNKEKIRQLTVDHTYVQELVNSNKLAPEEALTHPQSHILTKCIGAEPGLEVEIQRYWIWPTEPGEKQEHLIFVTDGLYTLVDETEIVSIVSSEPPEEACVKLVELAKDRGGYDNITIAIIPLGGALKSEKPEGVTTWSKKTSGTHTRAEAEKSQKQRFSFRNLLTYWVLFTIIALAVVAGGMFLLLNQQLNLNF
jgi:PPM family protein phosphatase